MVIVDECHHVSAAGFEQVLRAVPARYVYGLTATPARADGHEPIITMQCGPIRYQVSAKEQAERQGFARVVVPRFTRFALPSLSARSVQRMIPLLQRLQHKGGEVRIYLPDPAQFRADIQPKITANAAALQRAGIPVMFCPNRLPNFCILDQRLVWYGSLNPLGRMPDGESCLRMDAPDVAAELTEFLRGKREGA